MWSRVCSLAWFRVFLAVFEHQGVLFGMVSAASGSFLSSRWALWHGFDSVRQFSFIKVGSLAWFRQRPAVFFHQGVLFGMVSAASGSVLSSRFSLWHGFARDRQLSRM